MLRFKNILVVCEANLRMFNLWRMQEEPALRSGCFPVDKFEVGNILEQERSKSTAYHAEFPVRFSIGSATFSTFYTKGLEGEMMPIHGTKLRIDAIAMGTVGLTEITGLAIGNAAKSILNTLHCLITAVKPPGVVSPVASAS